MLVRGLQATPTHSLAIIAPGHQAHLAETAKGHLSRSWETVNGIAQATRPYGFGFHCVAVEFEEDGTRERFSAEQEQIRVFRDDGRYQAF